MHAVGPGGDETVCGFRGPGSLLGLELLDNVPADYQAWALTPSIVCALSAPAFAQWIGTLDSPMGAVLRLALREASRRREERVALAGRTVERLARFLLERRRIDGRDVPLEVQHQVLARMLGMRAETLSRAIAALRRKGVLSRGRELTVADPVRLAEVARAATT